MKKRIAVFVGILIFVISCTPNSAGENDSLEIHDIQGCVQRSPYEGEEVSGINGVVTVKSVDGFVMQSVKPDDQACSSEAIFVFTNQYPQVNIADLVEVEGLVQEYSNGSKDDHLLSQTEIVNPKVRVIHSGESIPDPITIGEEGFHIPSQIEDDSFWEFDIENDAIDAFEALEWMSVYLPESVVVAPRNSYNEISVVENSANNRTALSKDSVYSTEENSSISVPIMIDLPDGWNTRINTGDVISSMTGIMEYSYGNYKVEVNAFPTIVQSADSNSNRTDDENYSGLRIVSYNIENFSRFSSQSKLNKLAKQITNELNSPDLVILQEVEDDSGEMDDGQTSAQSNLELLVSRIADSGGEDYLFFDSPVENNSTGGIPGGNIRTAFLVKKSSKLKINSTGIPAENGGSVTFDNQNQAVFSTNPMLIGTEENAFSNCRKPIAALFTWKGRQIIVVGVHLISHGADSPLYGDIQPPDTADNAQRLEQASVITQWVNEIQSHNNELIILVAGDFNDSSTSMTGELFSEQGLLNTNELIPTKERFSIIEDGFAAQFDQILVTDFQNFNQSSFMIHHLNSISDFKSAISDHDPVEYWFLP